MPVLATTAFPTGSEVFDLVRALLMDRDILPPVTIPPTGAVRASNIATITTNSAHGLQIGNVVQVQSVSDSSFSGTQTVINVPTSTSFQYVNVGGPATSGNGIVQEIVQGDWATDAVLLPFANKAYRKVQNKLLANGSKTQTNEAYTTLPVNAIQWLDTTSPALPADFLAPRDLAERINGSGLAYVPMRQVNVLPSFQDNTIRNTNGMYAWFNEGLFFLGAINALDVRLRYFTALPDISDGTGQFLIRGSEDAIASQTAFLASRSRTGASIFADMYQEDIKELLKMQAHARNYVVGRRKPNNYGRGSSSPWGSRIL